MAERLVFFVNSRQPTLLNDFYNNFVIYVGHANIKFSEIDPNVRTYDAIMRDVRYILRDPAPIHIIRVDDQIYENYIIHNIRTTLARHYNIVTYDYDFHNFNEMDIDHRGLARLEYDYQMYHIGREIDHILNLQLGEPDELDED